MSVIDSLQQVIAHKNALLAAAIAHPETVVIPDTVVRVASASLGWWAEFWRIIAQVGAASLAVLGGAMVQRHFKNREERAKDEAASRADEEIRNQLAIGVGSICARLRPIHDKIVRNEGVFPGEIAEVTRRVHLFETLIPRALQLRDRAHTTRIYIWFSLAEWLPEDLELLAGKLRDYGQHPDPKPLDPELARLWEELAPGQRTRREAALARIARVLDGEETLGPVMDIYDPGGDEPLVPILTGRRPQSMPDPSPPTPSNQAVPAPQNDSGGGARDRRVDDKSGNAITSLSDFIEAHYRLLSALGVMVALTVFAGNLSDRVLGQVLSFLFLTGAMLVFVDLFAKFPKSNEWRLSWFTTIVALALLLMFIVWLFDLELTMGVQGIRTFMFLVSLAIAAGLLRISRWLLNTTGLGAKISAWAPARLPAVRLSLGLGLFLVLVVAAQRVVDRAAPPLAEFLQAMRDSSQGADR